MQNWELQLGKRIIYKNRQKGFLSAITKAERGYGKSMYNLKAMAMALYHLLGLSEEEAYKMALDNMIFTPKQFLNLIEHNIAKDYISPVICIDDATVHFSSYLYFINLYETSLLSASFDTIRTATRALLINCPDKKRLLPGLRHYDDYEVTIYMDRGYERRAVGIKWYSLPDGKRRFRKEFEDHFSCYVPDYIYDEYIVQRKNYLKEISTELKSLMTKLNKKKKDLNSR